MNLNRDRRWTAALRISAFSFLIGTGVAARPALAEDAVCKTVFDAMTRTITTPNHQYMSSTRGANGGKPTASETINTGKARYIQFGGRWKASAITADEELKQSNENREHNKSTCRFVHDESIDGTNAALYSVHVVTEYGTNDTQVWISKTSGLPVHQKIDIDVGAGAAGKTRMDVRFEYSGVAAPALTAN